MWVALLNLENMYGSQESLAKVFERAVQYNEPLKVFLHLADIYTKSEKFKVGFYVPCLDVPDARLLQARATVWRALPPGSPDHISAHRPSPS